MKNNKGFTTVEGLLILVVVAIIGAVGFYVYKSNKDLDQTQQATLKSSSSTVKTDSSPAKNEAIPTPVEYIELKDLGIKIKKTDSVKDLMFKTEKDVPETYYVQSKEVNELLSKCNSATESEQMASTFTFIGIGRGEGKFNKEEVGASELVKQFPDFYVAVSYPNGSVCGGAKEELQARKLWPALQADVKQALRDSELL